MNRDPRDVTTIEDISVATVSWTKLVTKVARHCHCVTEIMSIYARTILEWQATPYNGQHGTTVYIVVVQLKLMENKMLHATEDERPYERKR